MQSDLPQPNEALSFDALFRRAFTAADEGARNEAFGRLEFLMLAIVRGLGPNRRASESLEICHSVLKDFLVSPPDPEALADPRAYVRAAIRHKLVRHAGSLREASLAAPPDSIAPAAPDAPDPGDHKALAEALCHLDATDRLIVDLRARGLSYSAIADRTGLTEAAVRQRHSRAARQIRERLKDA